MRVTILGGTRFIGRAIAVELAARGHDVAVLHRGEHPATGLPESIERRSCDRDDAAAVRSAVATLRSEALVDTRAMSRDHAARTLEAAGDLRLCVLSSVDVYAVYGAQFAGVEEPLADAVPIDETGKLRTLRFPYRGKMPGADDYDKLDVEDAFLARGATVCRLPVVYGEHDYKAREEFVLRRVRAGRRRIPFGKGDGLWTRGYVADIARGVALAVEHDDARGEIFNLGESRTWTVRAWSERILEAAGWEAELVPVDAASLPEDLELSRSQTPMLFDSSKARARLGFTETEPDVAVARSVAWHLAHPPEDASGDFSADDRALDARLEA